MLISRKPVATGTGSRFDSSVYKASAQQSSDLAVAAVPQEPVSAVGALTDLNLVRRDLPLCRQFNGGRVQAVQAFQKAQGLGGGQPGRHSPSHSQPNQPLKLLTRPRQQSAVGELGGWGHAQAVAALLASPAPEEHKAHHRRHHRHCEVKGMAGGKISGGSAKTKRAAQVQLLLPPDAGCRLAAERAADQASSSHSKGCTQEQRAPHLPPPPPQSPQPAPRTRRRSAAPAGRPHCHCRCWAAAQLPARSLARCW